MLQAALKIFVMHYLPTFWVKGQGELYKTGLLRSLASRVLKQDKPLPTPARETM